MCEIKGSTKVNSNAAFADRAAKYRLDFSNMGTIELFLQNSYKKNSQTVDAVHCLFKLFMFPRT